jgi:hypothetical protein
MKEIALSSLSEFVRRQILQAIEEPVLIADAGKPLLVIQNLLKDDVVDDLLARHPAFQASIARARQHGASGQAKTLAELREKYDSH